MEMLGELELIRLIEENEYPARLVSAGVVWILDWRERRTRNLRELSPALRKIGIAA